MRQHPRLVFGRLFGGKPIPDLVVSQPRLGVHHRRVEAVLLDVAETGDFHFAHHAQAVHLGVQRTQPVGEFLWQHGNDPAREIHRVAAFQGRHIQRRTRQHIVGHVGDRYPQAEAAPFRLAIHGVVEIAGILAVDGHQR